MEETAHRSRGTAVPTVDLAKLTAIVRNFERPKALRRLVRSVRRSCPQLRLLVADDSTEPRPVKGVECLQLPSDSGRATCQNALLARVRTPYFLLLDNTAELHRGTRIEQLLQLLVDDKLDVAAGEIVACRRRLLWFTRRRPQSEHGLCQLAGDQLTLARGVRSHGDGFSWCDLVGNFYVARTGKVRALGGWDPELRDEEREEFFVRAQRHGLRVGIAPEVTIWHWLEASEARLPATRQDQMPLSVAKMGLARMTDFDGNVVKAPRRGQAA
jgi:Glycosyl transferase family 2